ncbi:hypothetical protein PIB30_072751 [Stylosanthes scabra]|uniref:Uncharacterized protein n=1 Tax=Stylosanthes scabra TaxID=79078 RepID=A0ABU6RPC9_9FABA|nr:hypothetical protein [Stylosanthes scabra]
MKSRTPRWSKRGVHSSTKARQASQSSQCFLQTWSKRNTHHASQAHHQVSKPRLEEGAPRLDMGFRHSPRLDVVNKRDAHTKFKTWFIQAQSKLSPSSWQAPKTHVQCTFRLGPNVGLDVIINVPQASYMTLLHDPGPRSSYRFVNPRGNNTLLTFYYLIRSGALADGASKLRKGFGHHIMGHENGKDWQENKRKIMEQRQLKKAKRESKVKFSSWRMQRQKSNIRNTSWTYQL